MGHRHHEDGRRRHLLCALADGPSSCLDGVRRQGRRPRGGSSVRAGTSQGRRNAEDKRAVPRRVPQSGIPDRRRREDHLHTGGVGRGQRSCSESQEGCAGSRPFRNPRGPGQEGRPDKGLRRRSWPLRMRGEHPDHQRTVEDRERSRRILHRPRMLRLRQRLRRTGHALPVQEEDGLSGRRGEEP